MHVAYDNIVHLVFDKQVLRVTSTSHKQVMWPPRIAYPDMAYPSEFIHWPLENLN